MDLNLMIEKISNHYNEKLPFVVYSLPQSGSISVLLQKNDSLNTIENLGGNGFVFAPFEYKGFSYFIDENDSEKHQFDFKSEAIESISVAVSEDISEQNTYIKLLSKTIETIKGSRANKIVISRFQNFQLKDFSIEKLIIQLFSKNPTAFRYIWYHPKTGLWCGATPETLVQIENKSFKTMALAGTQPFTNQEPVIWGVKEEYEQQLVTDAIINSLQRVTSVLKVSKTYTHRAGSLLHLRTDISGVLRTGEATLAKIAKALHPTPAVCGSPQQFAQQFIIENEGYDREFYTGFLGPILDDGNTASLMVNLRCMKIDDNQARIFVGGGITLASQPQEEYEETKNKLQTMLQVLQPML
ncbi:isochorismate synthase family protein [Aequorivita sublithincola DSM 14238]|uniref:isochorismate synthase n=1 Tax=Aequorivita sublithincola (strain DSM 14238 / LMG 21431 / ACAM 643 / 9-3) TaxID=746697 RepID=I3YYH0_AEQSU|nr:isochorismate synthase [Aequorivita sublithincola]AFL82038.1 isochorismate synthase family protein [Aequorivita sublithincola DSM 14238]